jgi:putative holliday junction resolvase
VREGPFDLLTIPAGGLAFHETRIQPGSIIARMNARSDDLTAPQLHPRILGLDVGSKTIGLAVSDPLGITAQGLQTIRRQNKRVDFDRLGKVIQEYEIAEIVVGYPLRMSGAEGTQAEKMQGFADQLRERFQIPVHLWDERLTSAEANRLLRETEMSIKRRGEVVDRMAAVLILQSWMEAAKTGNQRPSGDQRRPTSD